ncbi:MAG: RES domain-containing protein [Undibacterium sp.]|nr:RES domain-containing protein [Opitutaceae bacterium]
MSPVTVWRLCRKPYAAESYSGEGTRLFGGRWRPVRLPVAYSSESRSLATLEVLANARAPDLLFAQPWVMIAAALPLEIIERPVRVPDNWRTTPCGPDTQAFGAEWARAARSAALRVPSTVVLGEFNYLLNPAHRDFTKIKVDAPEPFAFDLRLHR